MWASTHLELDTNSELRLLALAPLQMQGQIRRQLAPLGVTIDFVSKATDVSQPGAEHRVLYQVALLPAALPDNGWWSLWGEIAVLNPRPEILVYAQSASFRALVRRVGDGWLRRDCGTVQAMTSYSKR